MFKTIVQYTDEEIEDNEKYHNSIGYEEDLLQQTGRNQEVS